MCAGQLLGTRMALLGCRLLDIDDPDWCLRLFKSNRDAGLFLFAGLVLDAVARG